MKVFVQKTFLLIRRLDSIKRLQQHHLPVTYNQMKLQPQIKVQKKKIIMMRQKSSILQQMDQSKSSYKITMSFSVPQFSQTRISWLHLFRTLAQIQVQRTRLLTAQRTMSAVLGIALSSKKRQRSRKHKIPKSKLSCSSEQQVNPFSTR